MSKRIIYMLTEKAYHELANEVCDALVIVTKDKFSATEVLKAAFLFADVLAKYEKKFFGEEDHNDGC